MNLGDEDLESQADTLQKKSNELSSKAKVHLYFAY